MGELTQHPEAVNTRAPIRVSTPAAVRNAGPARSRALPLAAAATSTAAAAAHEHEEQEERYEALQAAEKGQCQVRTASGGRLGQRHRGWGRRGPARIIPLS